MISAICVSCRDEVAKAIRRYECGTDKWSKALGEEGDADALFLKRKDKQC